MKQMRKILLSFLLCAGMFIGNGFMVSAAVQDGLDVQMTADKEIYQKDEEAKLTVKLHNTNSTDMEGVTVKVDLPEGLQISEDSSALISLNQLKADETKEIVVKIKEGKAVVTGPEADQSKVVSSPKAQTSKSAKTGDTARPVAALGILLVALGIMLYILRKKKSMFMLGAALLVGTLTIGGINVQAAGVKKSFSVEHTLNFDKKDYKIKVNLIYDSLGDADQPDLDDTDKVKRNEWILSLMDAVNLAAGEYDVYSFDDYSLTESADRIECAIRNGMLELAADEDNMVYFKPDGYVTREFAAYTAVRALNYTLEEAAVSWNDKDMLLYPREDSAAVKLGLFELIDNNFMPDQKLTHAELEQIITVIKNIVESAKVDPDHEDNIEYVQGVEETTLRYELYEEESKIIVLEPEKVIGWKAGEVHALISSDVSVPDIAIKITEITPGDDRTVIYYGEPEIGEVVESFEVEGVNDYEGDFIPAEDIVVENAAQSRASASGAVPLFDPMELKVDLPGGGEAKASLHIKEIEYKFDADPTLFDLNLNEVYLAVNSEVKLGAKYERELYKKIHLGTMKVPLAYGFNLSGQLYLNVNGEGKASVGFEVSNSTGIQYTKSTGIRPVFSLEYTPKELVLEGSIKGGISVEPGVQFLGIDIVRLAGEFGGASDAVMDHISATPLQFCLDGKLYDYLTIAAQVGPDILNIKYNNDVITARNANFKLPFHFEETGIKEECTRNMGDYAGSVKRVNSQDPVANAKVQVYRDGNLVDTVYAGEDGNFKGNRLRKGTYKLRVSAAGYIPHEQEFSIVSGQTNQIETQLMILRSDVSGSAVCSGTVTNAYTGEPVPQVKIDVYSQELNHGNDIIQTIYSGEDGKYTFQANAGKYRLVAEKDGFVTNTVYTTLVEEQTDLQIVLNPTNLPSVDGNMRVVLTWGEYPYDLDSHMVQISDEGNYHTYFSDMSEGNMSLDVDDINSYGPETITVTNAENEKYEYYIHDYTNKDSSSSGELAGSSAKVQIYAGDRLMYTINVPQNREGTLWHVFDYDAATGAISLINEISYESSPSNVGNHLRARIVSPESDIKKEDSGSDQQENTDEIENTDVKAEDQSAQEGDDSTEIQTEVIEEQEETIEE